MTKVLLFTSLGKTILDIHYDDKYIVYATGNDSPLEKFNSIVANTQLPWESEDEKEYILPLGSV